MGRGGGVRIQSGTQVILEPKDKEALHPVTPTQTAEVGCRAAEHVKRGVLVAGSRARWICGTAPWSDRWRTQSGSNSAEMWGVSRESVDASKRI